MGLRMHDVRAHASTRRQRAVHPTQMRLCHFYPTFTDRRLAALLERQAMAAAVEQGKVAKRGV